MKLALAQINPIVGDIRGNTRLILSTLRRAERRGADLVAFPELCLTGYPPRDLVEQPRFIEENLKALGTLVKSVRETAIIVGFIDRNPQPSGKAICNSAALLHRGKVVEVRHKQLLPTYDVFDETRHFAPGTDNQPIAFKGAQIGLTICEDIWNDRQFWPRPGYASDPVQDLARLGADLFINISSSPFHAGKSRLRLDMIRSHVRQIQKPFYFVNQVGGNDDLIFDGTSLGVEADGRLVAQGKSFEDDLVLIDTQNPGTREWTETPDIELLRDALTLGLRDYTRKCGFTQVVLGLSGGIDSAVTAALAVRAVGKANVLGVLMPSAFSSKGSVKDALSLAKKIGIKTLTLPIKSSFTSLKSALKPAFRGTKADVTEENLQARIRGTLLMALSNKFGRLLLTTGNKSELSMGYCTLYGDMNGGLAVISDVPKMTVYALGRLLNRDVNAIPEDTFTKPPSAELRPNQTDGDSLPPYPTLDAIVEAYVEKEQDVDEIVAQGFDQKLVSKILTAIDRNEYKRRQAAPGLRITPKAFGLGRRLPIARGDFRR